MVYACNVCGRAGAGPEGRRGWLPLPLRGAIPHGAWASAAPVLVMTRVSFEYDTDVSNALIRIATQNRNGTEAGYIPEWGCGVG